MIAVMMTMIVATDFGQPDKTLPFPVFLNHFFLVVDTETHAAIEADSFLRKEFAPNESRTTRRTDITYTGLYFYGVDTYFEFFDVGKETRRKLGDSGIAFGVEQEGATKVLQERLKTTPANTVTRPLGDRQVNWFYSLAPKSFSFASGMSSWVMEYHPNFLSEWNPQGGDSNQGITRRQALTRYVAVLKERPAQPVLKDVLSISIAVDKTTADSLAAMCAAFDYRARSEGEARVFEGPDFVLRVLPESSSARGIQQFTMRVSREPVQREFRFGKKSVLKFNGDNTATWSF